MAETEDKPKASRAQTRGGMGRSGEVGAEVGVVLGKVQLSDAVLSSAAALARQHYRQQEDAEFCGDAVESILLPSWLKDSRSWLPDLSGLDVIADPGCADLLATASVDPHTDGVNGFTLCVVLHNDGLTFQQGRKRITPVAGDYFIFDDRKNHAVHPTRTSTTFLCMTAPVRPTV